MRRQLEDYEKVGGTMTYTEQDIQLATKLLQHGYKYVVRDQSGDVFVCKTEPVRDYMFDIFIFYYDDRKLPSKHFKPVTKKAVKLTDILLTE